MCVGWCSTNISNKRKKEKKASGEEQKKNVPKFAHNVYLSWRLKLCSRRGKRKKRKRYLFRIMKQKRWVHIYVFYVNTPYTVEVGLKAFWDSLRMLQIMAWEIFYVPFSYRRRKRESKCRYMLEQFYSVLLLDIHNNVCFAWCSLERENFFAWGFNAIFE